MCCWARSVSLPWEALVVGEVIGCKSYKHHKGEASNYNTSDGTAVQAALGRI